MDETQRKGLNRYSDLYLWMLFPMAIMQLGIFVDYWGDLTDNAWPVHVHYWTASFWYAFLVLQPYFAARRQFERHRTYGIIGFFLAGGVALTAISALNRDMANAERAAQFPERFGPFEPWFFYGVAAVELVMMSAFIVAIIQSIRHRKSLQDHAWWLISTVFIIMMPALARGLGFLWGVLFGPGPGQTTEVLYISTALTVALLAWGAQRYGRFNHPATLLALGVNLFNLLVYPLGNWVPLQQFLHAVMKS